MLSSPGLVHRRIQRVHAFFEAEFVDQVILHDMLRKSPQYWFDTCVVKTRQWLEKNTRQMEIMIEKPVAMLLGVEAAEEQAEAAADKCTRMTRSLVPEFERALERSDGANPPADFTALCVLARDIVSEMAGRIVGYGAEVDNLTIDSG